jgi:GTPase SAR1 family protein
MKNLIFHNVKNYDKLVKIMLIGEKEVGKTLFLNKILNKNIINEKYSSTEFLNIKKINTVINNQNIKLEFWDSNVNFLNSILINIYYKIANCFIIIVNEKSNFNFIEKQVSEIQSVNKTENIFFIFNCNLKENENINSLENEENFKKLCNDYYISFHRINLTEISLNNRDFSLFLESMILK